MADSLVDLVEIDENGNENILARYDESNSFVLYSYEQDFRFLEIKKDSTIVLVNIAEIYNPSKSSCPLRNKIMENLIKVLYKQVEYFSMKINICSCTSLRERIMKYLDYLQAGNYNNKLDLPFNREELSNYLACNRSALSRELSNMKKEKLIKINKNTIYIL